MNMYKHKKPKGKEMTDVEYLRKYELLEDLLRSEGDLYA